MAPNRSGIPLNRLYYEIYPNCQLLMYLRSQNYLLISSLRAFQARRVNSAWRETDNGRPVPVHRVNYLQRGIRLGEGRHRIEMVFRPAAFYVGRWITVLGALGALLLLSRGAIRGMIAGRHSKGQS